MDRPPAITIDGPAASPGERESASRLTLPLLCADNRARARALFAGTHFLLLSATGPPGFHFPLST